MLISKKKPIGIKWCLWCGNSLPPRPPRGGRPGRYCSITCAHEDLDDSYARNRCWRERQNIRSAIRWFEGAI